MQVEGTIPAGLEGGLYLRTGSNARCWPPTGFSFSVQKEKVKVFESLSLGRVHAFGPDAMLHRVSLETSAEENESLEAIYSNSWIQAKKENRQKK